jgi:hypothetical protein
VCNVGWIESLWFQLFNSFLVLFSSL